MRRFWDTAGVRGGTTPGGTRTSLEADVQALASDAFQGRDNNTHGSLLTQNYLIAQLKQFSVPARLVTRGDFADSDAQADAVTYATDTLSARG